MYDILIKNGRIIDGTGSPAMLAQIAVKDGKIVKIARHIAGNEVSSYIRLIRSLAVEVEAI